MNTSSTNSDDDFISSILDELKPYGEMDYDALLSSLDGYDDDYDDGSVIDDYDYDFSKEETEAITHDIESQEAAPNGKRQLARDTDMGGDKHLLKKRYIDRMKARTDDRRRRRQYLSSVPKLLAVAFNSGDFKAVRHIIEEACTEDCSLQVTVGAPELVGRENVVELFQHTMRTIPDGVLISKPSSFKNRRITATMIFYGTRIYTTDPANTIKYYNEDEARVEAEAAACMGGPYCMYRVGKMGLLLDSEHQKVQKMAYFWRIIDHSPPSRGTLLENVLPSRLLHSLSSNSIEPKAAKLIHPFINHATSTSNKDTGDNCEGRAHREDIEIEATSDNDNVPAYAEKLHVHSAPPLAPAPSLFIPLDSNSRQPQEQSTCCTGLRELPPGSTIASTDTHPAQPPVEPQSRLATARYTAIQSTPIPRI